MKCEGCKEEIIHDPHIEKVWEDIARQYWHTNCFVYAHPPEWFPPPDKPLQSLEALIEAYETKKE